MVKLNDNEAPYVDPKTGAPRWTNPAKDAAFRDMVRQNVLTNVGGTRDIAIREYEREQEEADAEWEAEGRPRRDSPRPPGRPSRFSEDQDRIILAAGNSIDAWVELGEANLRQRLNRTQVRDRLKYLKRKARDGGDEIEGSAS